MLSSFASCADSINNLSAEIYAIDGFSSSSLVHEGIGVLPTVSGDGTKDESLMVSRLLGDQMAAKVPGNRLTGPDKIGEKIAKDPNLGRLWAQIEPHVSAHSVKGLEATQFLGQSLGIRFLLETQIQMAEEAGGAEQVRIFARIYDINRKRIVWEGFGEGRGYVKLFFPSVPATFRETATVAVRGIISKIFSN